MPLKALVAQINYNLFDIELGNQQSQFAYLQAKDLTDTIEGVMHTHDLAVERYRHFAEHADHDAVLRRGVANCREGKLDQHYHSRTEWTI